VWPHLLAIEFVALLAMLALLTLMSVFIDAPLLEFANFNEQPNPSKAPWYFLGLQELLAYFDPQVAGVIVPGFGVVALAFIPYIDRNPSVRPSDRKFAISIFTVFVMASSILTIFGSFFRGPGFNFTFPWRDGIFFDDLKTILE
jgi:quinol-cytochrome oxidoreductase complex cytochrome b subunit